MPYCPNKMSNPQLTYHYDATSGVVTEQSWECEGAACALWSEHFGMCSLKIDAFLKGIEDSRKEQGSHETD